MNKESNRLSKFIKKETPEEENSKKNRTYLGEISSDDEEESKSDKKNSNKSKSMSDSFDEEMPTLLQLNKIIEKNNEKKKNASSVKRSLLNRKTLLDKNSIIYDEKKGDLINIFSPSIEELDTFLMKCSVQKISLERLSESTISSSNSYVFDPNKWMKSNKIEQRTINFEDLSLYCLKKFPKNNQKENNAPNIKKQKIIKEEKESIKIKEEKEPIKLNEEKNEKSENIHLSTIFHNKKVKDNNEHLQKIISSQILSTDQKKWLNIFLDEISKTDIKEILVKDKKGIDEKIELVFDLDNTCIFSFLTHPNCLLVKNKQNIYSVKNVKTISFNYDNNVLYSMLIIRKGLKEFVQYAKPLCNFHISTLGAEAYGKEIMGILIDYCGIVFDRFKGRQYKNEYEKNISDLYIEKEKTIIIDDNIKVWANSSKDHDNVIISKFFYDEECSLESLNENALNNEQINNINLFLSAYRGFSYNKIIDNNIDWKNQEIIEYTLIYFYQFKKNKSSNDSIHSNYNQCFTAEYLDSKKLQFIYLKNVIKQIYCLKFIYNIDIPLAIKLIRISTLANIIFYLKYLNSEQRKILTDMVKVCGGIIFDKNKRIRNEKVYLIASKNIYEFNKEQIKEDLSMHPYYVLLNERFILDSFYLMTSLKENINDSEYKFDDFN